MRDPRWQCTRCQTRFLMISRMPMYLAKGKLVCGNCAHALTNRHWKGQVMAIERKEQFRPQPQLAYAYR